MESSPYLSNMIKSTAKTLLTKNSESNVRVKQILMGNVSKKSSKSSLTDVWDTDILDTSSIETWNEWSVSLKMSSPEK